MEEENEWKWHVIKTAATKLGNEVYFDEIFFF